MAQSKSNNEPELSLTQQVENSVTEMDKLESARLQEINVLATELDECKAENTKLESRYVERQRVNKNLTEQIELVDINTMKFQTSFDQFCFATSTVNDVMQEYKNQAELMMQAEQELEELKLKHRNEHLDMDLEIHNLSTEYDRLQEQIAESRQKNETANDQIDNILLEIETLKANDAEKEAEIGKYSSETEVLSVECQELMTILNITNDKLSKVNVECDEMTQHLSIDEGLFNIEKVELTDKIDSLNKERDHVRENICELIEKRDSIEQTITELQSDVVLKNDELDPIKSKLALALDEMNNEKFQLSKLIERNCSTDEQLHQVVKMNLDGKIRINQTKAEIGQFELDISSGQLEYQKQINKNMITERKIEILQLKRSNSNNELKSMNLKSDGLQEKLTLQMQEFVKVETDLDDEQRKLKFEFDDHVMKFDKLATSKNDEILKLEHNLTLNDGFEDIMKDLELRYDQLQNKITEHEQAKGKFQKHIEQRRKKLAMLKDEHFDLKSHFEDGHQEIMFNRKNEIAKLKKKISHFDMKLVKVKANQAKFVKFQTKKKRLLLELDELNEEIKKAESSMNILCPLGLPPTELVIPSNSTLSPSDRVNRWLKTTKNSVDNRENKVAATAHGKPMKKGNRTPKGRNLNTKLNTKPKVKEQSGKQNKVLDDFGSDMDIFNF